MSRFGLTIVVAMLTFSASGIHALIFAEPCGSYEQPIDHGTCPPTCVTCGCCAQAAEPVILHVASAPDIPFAEIQALVPRFPKTQVRDILHVPKRRFG